MARKKMMHLKIVSQDKLMGPLPLETLVAMAAQGKISPEDLVRPGGSRAWLRVTEVPELAARLGARPDGVPSPPAKEASRPVADSSPPAIERSPPAVRPAPPVIEPPPISPEAAMPEAEAEWEAEEARAAVRLARRRPYEEAAMEMAPMIDVTFLLLIFFMLTNSLANPAAMDVPAAVHGRGVTLEGQQLILVDQDGRYYLGDTASEQSAADSLDALVEEVTQNSQESREPLEVIVSAHRDVKHRCVRQLVEGLAAIEDLGQILLGVEEKLN